MSAETWVIVLNWNGRDDTLRCLASLTAQTCESLQILLVDNGSHDGTSAAVAARFPEVRVLQTGSNLGYTGGNNAGITLALAEGAQFLCVLNNDTEAPPELLERLRGRVLERPDVAVSPRIVRSDGSVWFNGGREDLRTGLPRHLSAHEAEQHNPHAVRFVPTALLSGCCIFAAAGVWRTVGSFDDRFFLLFEDSDWSKRAVDAGVDLEVDNQSQLVHRVSASFIGTAAHLGHYYYARNAWAYHRRHGSGLGQRRRLIAECVLRPALRDVRSRQTGAGARIFLVALGLLHAVGGISGSAGPAAVRLTGKRT